MPEPARFKIGDRVVTYLYGAAVIEFFYLDQNIGWSYQLLLDLPITAPFFEERITLVEEALWPEPAIDRLARLARE